MRLQTGVGERRAPAAVVGWAGAPRPGVGGGLGRRVRLRGIRLKARIGVLSRPRRLRRAVAVARLVTAGTPDERRPLAVAARRLTDDAVCHAHLRDPGSASWIPIEHADLLRETFGEGRGVMLASVHSGAMWPCMRMLATLGIDLHVVVGPWFWDDSPGTGGSHHRRTLEALGVRLISSDHAAFDVPTALAAGGTCVITVDMPGTTETVLAGKRALVQNGFSRLAAKVGSPVVTAVSYVSGPEVRLRILDRIDPADRDGNRRDRAQHVFDGVFSSLDAAVSARPALWAPHTSELWPDHAERFRWAFNDQRTAP